MIKYYMYHNYQHIIDVSPSEKLGLEWTQERALVVSYYMGRK